MKHERNCLKTLTVFNQSHQTLHFCVYPLNVYHIDIHPYAQSSVLVVWKAKIYGISLFFSSLRKLELSGKDGIFRCLF